jgi:O-glycosyl hydrolase
MPRPWASPVRQGSLVQCRMSPPSPGSATATPCYLATTKAWREYVVGGKRHSGLSFARIHVLRRLIGRRCQMSHDYWAEGAPRPGLSRRRANKEVTDMDPRRGRKRPLDAPRSISRRTALRWLAGACGATVLARAGLAQAQDARSIHVTGGTMQIFFGFGFAPAAFSAAWYLADSSFTDPSVKAGLYDALFTELKINFLRWELSPAFQPHEGAAYDIDAATVATNHEDPTRAARDRNPGLKVLYSVWSPPGWMKQNGATTGGNGDGNPNTPTDNRLRYDKRDAFGVYLAEFAGRYRDRFGWPVDYLSLQNEPNLNTTYDSCVYTADEYVQMARAVRAQVNAYGNTETKLIGPEYAWAGDDYTAYVNANVGDGLDLLCIHGYAGAWGSDMGAVPSSARTAEPFFQTEFNYNYNVEDTPEQAAVLGNTFCGDVNNGNAGAWFFWQGVQEPDSNPGEGLLLANGSYKTTPVTKISGFTRTKRYYAFQSLTQTVRPGAIARWVTVGSDLSADIKACALKNPDGRLTIVLANRSGTTHNSIAIGVDQLAGSGTVAFTAHATDTDQSNNIWSYSLTDGFGYINLVPYQVIALAQD